MSRSLSSLRFLTKTLPQFKIQKLQLYLCDLTRVHRLSSKLTGSIPGDIAGSRYKHVQGLHLLLVHWNEAAVLYRSSSPCAHEINQGLEMARSPAR